MATMQATLYDVTDGVARITLNRPDRRNALSAQLITELHDHISVANDDPDVRVIVMTGAGSAFCAGADLADARSASDEPPRVSFVDTLTAMQDSAKPVVVAVNGPAFAGGLGLVCAADIVITVDTAQFSFSEVRIGVIPAIISVVCVPKLGTHHAMSLFLTGERFDGVRAVELGIAHRAVAADAFDAALQEQIDMLMLAGPVAMVETKKLVRRVQALSREQAFAETEAWSKRMFLGEEAAEGIAAFRERRQPNWVLPRSEV